MARACTPESDDNDDYDVQEHQGCYVFIPAGADTARPTKRRRTSGDKNATPTKPTQTPAKVDECLFPVLLNGKEPLEAVQIRWETYHQLWADQEARTNAILDSFNQQTLNDVSEFVKNADPEKYDNKIPTALVLTGPNIASHQPLFEQFKMRICDDDQAGPVVVLTSKDALNLKGTLKKLIKDATESDEGRDDEEDELIVGKRGSKLLNYDLQILQNWCVLHPEKKVVIAVQDTEAFDNHLLSDLISLFSAYLGRIPFVLLMGIATSLEIFHEKLPKAVIRMMQGEKFDVERADELLALVFNDAVLGPKSILRLGPSVSDIIIERQKNHTQSIQTFMSALKYAYMSHFYANPLSILLAFLDDPAGLKKMLTPQHLDAIRTLPSFRKHVEAALEAETVNTSEIRALLTNNAHLTAFVPALLTECHEYAKQLSSTLEVLELTRGCTSAAKIPRYELLPRVLSGDLHVESPLVRELLLSVKKMNSNSLLLLLSSLSSTSLGDTLSPLTSSISELVSETPVLTSEFDVATSSLRSTAVSKKIQISAHKSGLTKNDAEYSELLKKVHEALTECFTESLRPPTEVALHEIFFYNLPAPHKDVFAPCHRGTVEGALTKPADWLGCNCCGDDADEEEDEGGEASVKASLPPTSILYQLFLEGGQLVNAFDLWMAFKGVLEGEDEEEGVEEEAAQALFFRSVAELRWMGFLKGTKKRVDHLQKLAWKGL
ncbi:origin recognition complex subunit 3 N-terminus-domain-containing protein [Pyronema domesticum]|nr:origin recognition complex subunit 3 N-terminus-domain-containing protein [Pyronema domesticum]